MKALLALFLLSSPLLAAKPNVLFLFADDFSYEAVRAFGHTDIDTPNLDRLAARGTSFTRAYNMGSWSGAVCVASRTMLISGRSVWSAGKIWKTTDAERQSGVLWPQLMKKAGYKTYMTGKWHIETDAAKCFDVTRDVRGGMPKTVPSSYNRPIAGQPDAWSPFDKSLGGFWQGGTHWRRRSSWTATRSAASPCRQISSPSIRTKIPSAARTGCGMKTSRPCRARSWR